MDGMFTDWPWAEPSNHLDWTSDLLDDLALSQSSKSCKSEQHLFHWDEDLLGDFVLFPETESDAVEQFDKPSLPSHYDGETTSQSSPASSFTESISSPLIIPANIPSQHSPEDQHITEINVDSRRPQRRRHPSTVFPCTFCKRVSFTSVAARRHLARHVKPFKCTESRAFPLQLQNSFHPQPHASPPATSSSSPEGSICSKAFATKNELERHRKSVHYCIPEVGPKEWFKCPIFGCKVAERLWPRRDNLLVHMKQSHPESVGIELRAFIPERDGLLLH